KEERTAVGGRVRPGLVEGDAGDRRPAGVTARVVHHAVAVVIGVVRRHYRPGSAVKAGAQVQASTLVAALRPVPLIAGPAEVARGAAGGGGQPVDLLPGVPAHVAYPQLVGPRPLREPERVTQPVGHDPAGVRVRRCSQRVVRQALPGVWVDANDRTVQGGRAIGAPDTLAAQGAALRGGRVQRRAGRCRRVTARIRLVSGVGRAVLAVVDVVKTGAVARASVE